MKKLIYISLLFAACKSKINHDGTYVSHAEGQFSIADDTLIVADTVIIHHTGYQKIRNGKLLPKSFKTRKWSLNGADALPMQIKDNQIILGQTIYTRLP